MRSIRRWSYEMFGNDRAIQFVVLVTPEDMKANAEYVRMADLHVDAPGGSNNNNYANVNFIVDIAKRMNVQAVWAGWGHASENPLLPEALAANNIVFMGPPGHAMRSLGDKISSSIVAQAAGVPTMPWSGSGLTVPFKTGGKGEPLKVPDDIYEQGCVKTVAQGLASAQKIGFPCMIKASEGGGGKGIRKVTDSESFPTLFRQVQAEVPGSPIFIMKLASGARHLEVQILADTHGNCISLFGRDCSVQRRHQKIIEEGPAAICPPEIFDKMEKAAVRLGKMVSYVSAGTIEYLFSADGSFCFLELNPRLQVEHPCSEMISGVNLPAAQLQVAMGIPLYRMPEIRTLYGFDKYGKSEIPFDKAMLNPNPANPDELAKPEPDGHVIACRITAENPDDGFKPSSGLIQELNFRSSRQVWGYFSVAPRGGLHEFADSQFGHCFAWGETRNEARQAMVLALKELFIQGDFRTTVEYLVKLLEKEDFKNNAISTEWLDKLIEERMQAERPETMVAITCGAAHIADVELTKQLDEFSHSLSRGQLLSLDEIKPSKKLDILYENNKYVVEATRTGPKSYSLCMNGNFVEVGFHRLSDGGSLVRFNDDSRVVYMTEEVERYRMSVGGKTCIFEKENDPTVMRAVSAGKLIRYMVEDGDHVKVGDAYAEVEVMKMVMSVYAKETGCVRHTLIAGHILESGDIIAKLDLDDPSKVQKAELFTETFPVCSSPATLPSGEVHQQFHGIMEILTNVLNGYGLPEPFFQQRLVALVDKLFELFNERRLPLMETREILSSISSRVPETVAKAISEQLAEYERSLGSMLCKFPVQKIASIIDEAASEMAAAEQDALFLVTAPLSTVIQRYRSGLKGHMLLVVQGFLQQYLDIEKLFSQGRSTESVVLGLRKSDPDTVVDTCFSHSRISKKNAVVKMLLGRVFSMRSAASAGTQGKAVSAQDSVLQKCLEDLASLTNVESSKVALLVRQVLIKQYLP